MTNGLTTPVALPGVLEQTTTAGLLNVGPGSNPAAYVPNPSAPVANSPDATKGNVAGIWGYVGPLVESPSQTSQPPITCAVFGQGGNGGVVGVSGFAGTIQNSDAGSNGDGVLGYGGSNGVHGISTGGSGVTGKSTNGTGVAGTSTGGSGVVGTSQSAEGVFGTSTSGYGVVGTNTSGGGGVRGDTKDGVAGVIGVSTGKGLAGRFDGNVTVNGATTLNGAITLGGDCTMGGTMKIASGGDIVFSDFAEHFDLADVEAEPGTVMIIDDCGSLRPCEKAYDQKVAGVVSGAGAFRPGIVLGEHVGNSGTTIALVGRVYCKVSADAAPIAVGDLLTSSDTPGYAMKVTDPVKGFGSIIGKALRPLKSGRGLVPILVLLR